VGEPGSELQVRTSREMCFALLMVVTLRWPLLVTTILAAVPSSAAHHRAPARILGQCKPVATRSAFLAVTATSLSTGEGGPDLLLPVGELGTGERFAHMQHLEFLLESICCPRHCASKEVPHIGTRPYLCLVRCVGALDRMARRFPVSLTPSTETWWWSSVS